MQADYIREFFTEINTILPELANSLSRDNSIQIEKYLNKLETMVRKFRKRTKEDLKEIKIRKKQREWLEDDQL